jgi:fructose/tagatose bisphosphate aldolase
MGKPASCGRAKQYAPNKTRRNIEMDINNILKMVNRRPTAGDLLSGSERPATAISERRLYPHDWLVPLFEKANVTVVSADGMPVTQFLQNFGELSLDICTLYTDGRGGTNFLSYANERIEQVRSIAPNVGIMLVSTNKDNRINPNLLPARTWIVTPATNPDEVADYISECRYALNNNSFFRSISLFPTSSACDTKTNALLYKGALPNFNIKHPAMLLPLARIAARNNIPVFVEISPQEALVYYDYVGMGNDVYSRLNHVFKMLREDVSRVEHHTGAKMFLHLDHCNDAEIIRRAVECGFDSIMADGSNQSLSANIRFVRSVKRFAEPFGVPVEGEIGAIDPEGYRKKSTTICSELDIFVEATNADYVGVNVRQFHGCDYGFDRARMAYLQYTENKQKKDYALRDFIQSCSEVDDMLFEKGYSENSDERIAIKTLADRLLYANEDYLFSTLAEIKSNASISVNCWSNEIMNSWLIKQSLMSKRNRCLLEEVIGFGMKDCTFDEKSLDFELLASIEESLRNTNTRIVLHGGSSIKKTDLQFLSSYGVKRVNFGSHPYKLFINALRSEAVGKHNYRDEPTNNNPLEASYFVNKYSSNWKTWLADNPPTFLSDYEHEMETQFFKPMSMGLAI